MSETLTPVFRLEYFITAAASGTPCDLEPIFNEEKYLHAIAGASVDLPMPVGRTQEYLAKLAGMDVEIPDKPIYRTEYYLAHMIDNTVECPAPVFREEMFYYEWASNEYVTISGNPVSFTAVSAPLRQLKVAFSPVQAGSGDPSPDNVRPISGWSSLTVEQTGVNVWDEEWEVGTYNTSTGEKINGNNVRSKNFIGIIPNTVYREIDLSATTARAVVMCYYDGAKNFIRSATNTTNGTFKTPENARYMTFYCGVAYGTTYNHDISINYPSTDTAYHAYNPASQTISITIGQTVYSGYVDVVTGVVTVDMITADLSLLSWTRRVTGNINAVFSATLPSEYIGSNEDEDNHWLTSKYPYKGAKNATQLINHVDTYEAGIYSFPNAGEETNIIYTLLPVSEAAKSAGQLVYPLATPQTIQLTPQEVESLLGENNVWSTANGDITVEYRSN